MLALPSGRCTLLLNSFVLKGHHLGFNLLFCVLKKSPSFYELWPGRLLLRNKVRVNPSSFFTAQFFQGCLCCIES